MRDELPPPEIVWEPNDDAGTNTHIAHFSSWLGDRTGQRFEHFDALHAWSIAHIDAFWQAIADFAEIAWHAQPSASIAARSMPGTVWFPGGTLSYSEHALRHGSMRPESPAIVSLSQSRATTTWSWAQLEREVASVASWLREQGVQRGDRVAGYLPNVPETIAAFLAAANLGATWVSCAPEFGVRAVLDRLRQVEPVVLLAIDSYRFGDRVIARREELHEIREGLPSVRAVLRLSYLEGEAPSHDVDDWDELRARPTEPLAHDPVPFAHPLYVLFSSGTTGLPKPIVHATGGILLEHWKTLSLHHNISPGEAFFWFTTTGWMMWNYLVSALTVGATVVCFDGNPAYPDLTTLWRLVDEHRCVTFGTSAPFLIASHKAELDLREIAKFAALGEVGSTGSPLPAYVFTWLAKELPSVRVNSTSGGTDVCTAFVGGNPLVAVWAGEISRPMLGCDVAAFDENGDEAPIGVDGELVIRKPMPSMPVGFLNDADGSRYQAAYFDRFPGVWNHGDWIRFTERGSCIISGRSDATLNRSGVRIGTAELYAVIESIPEVTDSLVVHTEADDSLVLFVVVRDKLDENVVRTITQALRTELSPRHVPDRIIAIPAIPRTPTGKKLEIPIKRMLQGRTPEQAFSNAAIGDPAAIQSLIEALRSSEERGTTA